ncbi:MAG: FAD-binding protein [Bacteroidetes bacterium]|nr:MAG: FAD-binding protein [Bacteroidota bacterium]
MKDLLQFQLSPEEAVNDTAIRQMIKSKLSWTRNTDFYYKWVRRSIDARKPNIRINCSFEVVDSELEFTQLEPFEERNVVSAPPVHIVGSGPAGLFAALRCIEKGLKPIILERGKDVRTRRRDLAKLNRDMELNTESNYCFGEGGAGTYSDGKLYTRSKKRGDIKRALELFVHFGADPDILVDAHPHIGTNKLPQIIVAMREKIISCGGEVHFNAKLVDFEINKNAISRLILEDGREMECQHVILATGHSARDIFYLLNDKGLKLEAKGFALGVRIEHSQELIDQIQYHGRLNDEYLPPASYSLVTQANDHGVYSFCMCPGGIVAPCATGEGEVVTNGWSPSKRNNPYSNSGIVVSVLPEDLGDPNDPFVCLNFQKAVEQKCWEAAGKTQRVPAQRLMDFINNKVSKDLPETSYKPGLVSVNLNEVLPSLISDSLRKGFMDFGRKMKGFLTNEAVLHAPESRTSSPVLIPRNEKFMHPELVGLYPCGEGAGYAGGIISAAIDGMKIVDEISEELGSEV